MWGVLRSSVMVFLSFGRGPRIDFSNAPLDSPELLFVGGQEALRAALESLEGVVLGVEATPTLEGI